MPASGAKPWSTGQPYTVMQVLGHSSLSLIEKTYGHLLNVRHRSPVVEYRRTELLELAARRAESA